MQRWPLASSISLIKKKLPDHPVVVLLAENQTGLTLERGPATVLEADNYVGEAVLPFSPVGNEFFIPYAVDLGVKVIAHIDRSEVTTTLSMGAGDYLVRDSYRMLTTTYAIENRNPNALDLVIEQNQCYDYEIFDTPEPSAQTVEFRRWTVPVAARAQIEFVVREQSHLSRKESITNLSYRPSNLLR